MTDYLTATGATLPTNAKTCPRVVVGKRCLHGIAHRTCPCSLYPISLQRSPAIGRREDGSYVLTYSPAFVEADEFAAFLAAVDGLGLRVVIGRGPTVIVTKAMS